MLRLLYIVPLSLVGLGFVVGLVSVLAIPFVRRWAMHNMETVSKRLEQVRAQRDALERPRTLFSQLLAEDARKRAN